MEKTFDRKFELDWRSLNYPVSAALDPNKKYRPRSYTWKLNKYLDQGQEGACVGFGFSHELAAEPQVVQNVTNETARTLYKAAQKIDEWPGENYDGTSVLAGAKVCTSNGYYSAYHWGLTTEETVKAVGYFGPAVIGTNWYEAMFNTNGMGFIHPIGRLIGGHCLTIVGVKIKYKKRFFNWFCRTWDDVDLNESYFILHNSWGQSWGVNGRAYLYLSDFEKLLQQDIDICFPERTRKV